MRKTLTNETIHGRRGARFASGPCTVQEYLNRMEGWRDAWERVKNGGAIQVICEKCGGGSSATCSCAMERFRRQWESEQDYPRLCTYKRPAEDISPDPLTFGDVFTRFQACIAHVTKDTFDLMQAVKNAPDLTQAHERLLLLERVVLKK